MIQFKTKYEGDIVKRACKYAIGQIFIPLIVVAVIFFGLGIANFILSKNIVAGVLWIVFSLIYIPIVYFVVYLTQTNKYKSLYLKQIDKDLNLVDCCEFYEDSISLLTLAEKEGYSKELDREDLTYIDFVSVIEKSNEYIFTKKHSVIVIVPKESLIEGTIEDFNMLLTKKYGKYFKKITNKDIIEVKNNQTMQNEQKNEISNKSENNDSDENTNETTNNDVSENLTTESSDN